MLPKLGYFRAVDCPGLSQEGGCKRPYCHFRHSLTVSDSCGLEISTTSEIQDINQEIDKLQSQIDGEPINKKIIETCDSATVQPSYSHYISDAAIDDDCLPYTPYNGSALLYKPFKRDSANAQTVDHSKLTNEKSTSVLHAARGPSSLQSRKYLKKKKMNYTLSTGTKPVNNLEYDPMCNFNLKTKSKHDLTKFSEEETSDDNEVKHEALEDLPSTDLVIDDGILETNEVNTDLNITTSESQFEKDHNTSSVSDVETITIIDDNSTAKIEEDPIVISDSESDHDVKNNSTSSLHKALIASNEKVPVSSENQTLKNDIMHHKKSNEMSVFLFGSDSDNDNLPKFSARKTTSGKSRNLKLKRNSSECTLEEKSSTAQHPQSKKSKLAKDLNKKHPTSSGKMIKDKHKPSARRKDSNVKAAIKPKKQKLDTEAVESYADVAKYVNEKEIERLNKDLNDEGIFEECYRIFQEGLHETKSPNKQNLTKTPKTVSASSQVAATKRDETKECVPVTSRRSRVAYSASTNSASFLNRTVKQARRTLTPAQKMMQRIETIQLEQEEKILSAALKRTSSIQKPPDGGRVAHRPSTSLSTNSLSLSKKHVLASKALSSAQSTALANKRPFQDLRRPPSSISTTQGTVVKGCQRVAHASTSNSKDTDVPERPRILPDRHSKVPTNVRQRYLTVFIDECLRIFNNNHKKAYEMAMMEETQCSSRSKTKTIYLSLAASTVKKLREMPTNASQSNGKREIKTKSESPNNQTSSSISTKVVFKSNTRRISHGVSASEAVRLKEANKAKAPVQKSMSHKTLLDKSTRLCKGGYSFTTKVEDKVFSGEELYESMCRFIMTEDELSSNGFPRPDILPGKCKFMTELPKLNKDKTKKTCARCGKEFVLYKNGQFARKDDECLHHWGRAYSTKVGSNWEKRYSCCQTPIGAEGCSVGETHVHKDNTYDGNGYVRTLWKADTGNPGIFALDCEMAFTVGGLELIRVSVVDFDCKLVYDTLVQPSGKILDYNTRWSGLSEDDLKGITTTLRDVQAVLLSKFSSDTILLGHSLESDLKALRMIHNSVVDTSIVFPHRLGPPYKRALRNLMSEHLGIIIQNNVDEGHDSTEDASACVKLMKWKLSEDAKLSR